MTTMRRMLQRGVVLLALVALLAAACGGDTTTNDEAASESAPSTTVEETTTDSVTTDTAPPAPDTQESIVEPTPPATAERETDEEPDSPVLSWVRHDCRPWATKVNPEYPIPGTVEAAAVSKFSLDFGSGVMIAIEEDPGIVLLHYNGGSRDVEWAQPFDADAASTGDGPWYPVDEASADYLGLLRPPSPLEYYGDEVAVAMKECLASIQNWERGTEPSWAEAAAEAIAWMADASIAVDEADSPAERSATCAAVLADPEKDRAMDALNDIPFERGTIGGIRDNFHLMMISCKDGHFDDTAEGETRVAAAKEALSETLDTLGYPPLW
jgi:hypothetical protein